MRKILAVITLVGTVATANDVWAQAVSPITTPTCERGENETKKKPPSGDELITHKAELLEKKEKLAKELKALKVSEVADRRLLEERIELNRIALSYVQKALASYYEREDSIAECEGAVKRWKLVERIRGNSTDRQAALEVEKKIAREKLEAATEANKKLIKTGPSVTAYAKLSLNDARIDPGPAETPSRQADSGGSGSNTASETDKVKACKNMIAAPEVTLEIGACGAEAKLRSARSYGGGDVDFPSSVLRPRGLTANLTGDSSDGTVSLNYSDSFSYRLISQKLSLKDEDRVQVPWEYGYSIGVKAKDGLIFSRDDIEDDSIKDHIDGDASVTLGLFFNVYKGETLKEWNARAAKLTDAAVKACRKDQASEESKTPSTCTGQSLTNWVYHPNEERDALLRPELAKQADDLYFRSKDDKPVWGAGANVSVSRSNYDYLDPATFIADPMSKEDSDIDWNVAATGFAYLRLNPTSSTWDVSVIPSLTYSSRFGYTEGTKQKQFCPVATIGTPYVTEGCPSYYDTAPTRIKTWTPAAELRILTSRFGPFPSLGISPKLRYESIKGSKADRWRLDLPALIFVDKEKGLGVGVQYSREWGGRKDSAGFDKLKKEDEFKVIVSKTFSLTGN